jgi:hypothetical protein
MMLRAAGQVVTREFAGAFEVMADGKTVGFSVQVPPPPAVLSGRGGLSTSAVRQRWTVPVNSQWINPQSPRFVV